MDPMTMMNLASTVFGMFGSKQKSPDLFKAFQKGAEGQLNFLEMFGQRFMDQYRGLNPVFGNLESMVLGDLSDTGRTQRLEDAFQQKVYGAQAMRGVQNSPISALQSGFAGLQFGEQMRDKSMGNAFNLFQSGPYNKMFDLAGGPNLGIEQAALDSRTRQANRAAMLGQLNAGMNNQMGIQGMQNNQSFRNQLMNLYSVGGGSTASGGGGGWGGGGGNQGWGPLPGVASNTPWEGQY